MYSHLNATNSSQMLVGKTLLLSKGCGLWFGSAGHRECPHNLGLLQTDPKGGRYLGGPGEGSEGEEGLSLELPRDTACHESKKKRNGRERLVLKQGGPGNLILRRQGGEGGEEGRGGWRGGEGGGEGRVERYVKQYGVCACTRACVVTFSTTVLVSCSTAWRPASSSGDIPLPVDVGLPTRS